MNSIKNISIYGAGKAAWHLAKWLKRAGYQIDFIYNRSHQKAEELASAVQAEATTNLKRLMRSDLVLLTVSDDAIKQVAPTLPQGKAIVAHVSGNTSLEMLFPIENRGVIYPLQTFSREIKIEMKDVPFLLEASNPETKAKLEELARSLSPKVYSISSQQRRRLHVAAVFANNFVNHMYKNAYDICNENDIPFDVLLPLIKQTAEKVQMASPAQAQTGPAVRNDLNTIKLHLELLQGEQAELYQHVTTSIQKSLEN